MKNLFALRRNLKIKIRRTLSQRIWAPFCRMRYARLYRYPPAPERTIEIEIASVRSWVKGGAQWGLTFPGEIRDGDWDFQIVSRAERLAKSPKYHAMYQRFVEKRDWAETSIVEEFERLKAKSGEARGFVDLDEWIEHYTRTYDSLYESLQRNGILAAGPGQIGISPIYVHIGRAGDFIYTSDGNHRLFMAMVLGIKTIPVRVWIRHRRWQELRERVLGLDAKDLDGSDQGFLRHPDMKV